MRTTGTREWMTIFRGIVPPGCCVSITEAAEQAEMRQKFWDGRAR